MINKNEEGESLIHQFYGSTHKVLDNLRVMLLETSYTLPNTPIKRRGTALD